MQAPLERLGKHLPLPPEAQPIFGSATLLSTFPIARCLGLQQRQFQNILVHHSNQIVLLAHDMPGDIMSSEAEMDGRGNARREERYVSSKAVRGDSLLWATHLRRP